MWTKIAVVVALVVGAILLTGSRGGLGYFSPDTLEYQTQSEFRVLAGTLPIYRSARRDTENEMTNFLRESGFVKPTGRRPPRWVMVFHWSTSWKDGHGSLDRVLSRNRDAIIAWSKANPKLAGIYWSEGFKYLRADNDLEISMGGEILQYGWHCQSVKELREFIGGIEKENAEMLK